MPFFPPFVLEALVVAGGLALGCAYWQYKKYRAASAKLRQPLVLKSPTQLEWTPDELATLQGMLPTQADVMQKMVTIGYEHDFTWVLQEALAFRFIQRHMRLVKERSRELAKAHVAFHGTPSKDAARSIARVGLVAAGQVHPETGRTLVSAHGQMHGPGIYVSPNVPTAFSYSDRYSSVSHVFVCLVLRGLTNFEPRWQSSWYTGHDSYTTSCSTMWVLPRSDLVLPVYLVRRTTYKTTLASFEVSSWAHQDMVAFQAPPPPLPVILQVQGRGHRERRFQVTTNLGQTNKKPSRTSDGKTVFWFSRTELLQAPEGRAALHRFEVD
jgi:hypothetical protein